MAVLRTSVRCTFPVGRGGGTNTWHLQTLGGADINDAILEFTEDLEAFYTAIAVLCPTSYRWTHTGLFLEADTPEPNLLNPTPPWEVAGNGGSGYTGAASMACVTWRSGLATRAGRGRTFIGPLSSAAVDGTGTLDAGEFSALNLAATGLVTNSLASTSYRLVVWSETRQQANAVLQGATLDKVAVLRSRRG